VQVPFRYSLLLRNPDVCSTMRAASTASRGHPYGLASNADLISFPFLPEPVIDRTAAHTGATRFFHSIECPESFFIFILGRLMTVPSDHHRRHGTEGTNGQAMLPLLLELSLGVQARIFITSTLEYLGVDDYLPDKSSRRFSASFCRDDIASRLPVRDRSQELP